MPSNLLNELHMSPGNGTQSPRVVVTRPCPDRVLGRKLVPLLTGHLTGFAADAQTCIGEKAHGRLSRWRWLFQHWQDHALYAFQRLCPSESILRSVNGHHFPPSFMVGVLAARYT